MYPNMLSEVVEAVETHFCDDKDIIVDCILYLMNATSREEDVVQLENWLIDHNRCYKCGGELACSEYREYHPECGSGVYETMREMYCSECEGMNE